MSDADKNPDNGLPFRFERFDRVCFGGRDYVYLRATDEGHVLRIASSDLEETITHSEMAAKVLRRDFRHDRRFYAEGNVNARSRAAVACLNDLPAAELPKIVFKWEFCTRFLKLEAEGKASRTDASMTEAIKTISAEMLSEAAKLALLAGQPITTMKAPCPKTLRTWLAILEHNGLQAYALREANRLKGNREPRLDPEIYELLSEHANKFKSEKKPRVETLYKDLEIELNKKNETRRLQGLRCFPLPSIRALRLRIKALPAFEVYASRNGLDAARRYFNLVKTPAEVSRPGERIEMDAWTINLQKILIDLGLWAKLTQNERKAFTGRRQACVAIDVATRCILGLRIAPTDNSDLARQTLQMVTSDKSRFAGAVDARSPWDMRCTPDLVVTDGGPSFISDLFLATVADLESERDVAKSKMPHLRGTIERFFRTGDINLLPRFTGRSFENISEKGDYDSEARASLTEEDLAWCLIRWVVDSYHNLPHDGLGGETPRNAWLRLGKMFGVRPPPGRDKARAIFGVRLTRELSLRGVRFLGNHYRCQAIADTIFAKGLHTVEIRVDEEDLGRISVEIDGEWHVAVCDCKGFNGVSAST